MRILHVSDFHFNKRWFDWLATQAPECDLICHTGDFLDLRSRGGPCLPPYPVEEVLRVEPHHRPSPACSTCLSFAQRRTLFP
jgi:hypothetical protein